MARLELILKGDPQDHVVRSAEQSDEIVAQELAEVSSVIGRSERLDLPWCTAIGMNVRFARTIAGESHAQPPTVRGRSIMADLADAQF